MNKNYEFKGETLLESPNLNDAASLKRALCSFLMVDVGVAPEDASPRDWFLALAYILRGALVRKQIETHKAQQGGKAKRLHYLSMEYLPGRSLIKNLLDLNAVDIARSALNELGQNLEEVAEEEPDAALGNGGLGRLAACFLDSMATHGYPCTGYGLRYEFGMFNQGIEDGRQVERPERWLRYGNPWEFERPGVAFPVFFHGKMAEAQKADGRDARRWIDTEDVIARAYDIPVAGFGNRSVANLRLWAAHATESFSLHDFNRGDYVEAVREKTLSENLSKVLYPNDATAFGRELRLKQEHFFVSASLQDIIRGYLDHHDTFDAFPKKVAIQLNDTHPAQAVAELMRLLIDEHGVAWADAWKITSQTFAYTNHTLLPEALETWPIDMLAAVLPRHLDIIFRINHEFLKTVKKNYPKKPEMLSRVSLVDDGSRRIRMAHLAIVGSHKVNGVAELHTQLLRSRTFAEFDNLFPGKFVNQTNGITPRRWLLQANPALATLITRHIGEGWVTKLEEIKNLRPMADNKPFRDEFMAIKQANKRRFAKYLNRSYGVEVDPASMFDVQVKRIHEYKRQLLSLMHVITRYNRIKDGATDVVPRTVIFSGKAAPGYYMAKQIVRLINDIGETVNNDPDVNGILRVVFVPNYNVSSAEVIIPACDLSEQISTAGTEASGTGNMKLSLNGGLTIGTMDGANIEIFEGVGAENIFIFGMNAEEAQALRASGYDPSAIYRKNAELKRALDMIGQGAFSPDEPGRYRDIYDAHLRGGDHYLLLADYADYMDCQQRVDELYQTPDEWARQAVCNVAGVGKFSSDRTIHGYAREIWNIEQTR
ncbi:MAG: glycogen/starch/alpha-glucan phosphorylase [Rhodospirillales bacterium]|nr:glycogen/starch/alpha-glucan phosphorylase [Rhodospirillales bacterium]